MKQLHRPSFLGISGTAKRKDNACEIKDVDGLKPLTSGAQLDECKQIYSG